jgi:hypothetical protein
VPEERPARAADVTAPAPRSTAAALSGWLRTDGAPILGFAALAMFMAWRLGQEVSWDLRNYHFYNAYFLLDNRFTRDIEPAGVQTYFNPILDIPFYVAV